MASEEAIVEQQPSASTEGPSVRVKRRQPKQRQPANNPDGPSSSGVTNGDLDGNEAQRGAPDDEEVLKYGAEHVIHLFVPVSVCMALVVFTMYSVKFYSENDGVHLAYTPFVAKTESSWELLLQSFGNAFVMLIVVVVMTTILILLYKFRFYKVIHGWLILSSALLLSFFTLLYLQEVLKAFNVSVSTPTLVFFIINYSVLGMMCIHWKGPLLLQQFYLVSMSALMALTFIKYLPDWTVWTVLGVISVWDLVAVLCPKGPLRILVETAQERNEPIFPALIYSSGVAYAYVMTVSGDEDGEAGTRGPAASVGESASSNSSPQSTSSLLPANSGSAAATEAKAVRRFSPLRAQPRPILPEQQNALIDDAEQNQQGSSQTTRQRAERPRPNIPRGEDENERGIKLGLGDFIFYSVLVGKASSSYDWNTTLACYVAILIGLCFTLILLAVFRKALPALPVSIFAGLVFYFATREIVSPFCDAITARQLIF